MSEIHSINSPAIVIQKDSSLGELAAAINAAHEAGECASWTGLENFRLAGEALIQAKARCGHGKWLPWLKANVRFSQQTANCYMRIAQEWDKLPAAGNLRDALRLLTEDTAEPTTAQRIVQSGENEWYTPAKYIDAARNILGSIDLDPASSKKANKTVKADKIFTSEDDGMEKEWSGRVWLNPPYGRLAGEFSTKLVNEYKNGSVTSAVLLVNAHCTDTDWFQPLWDFPMCFTNHRIDFDSNDRDKETTSTHGSIFIYLGNKEKTFADEFSQFGAVVRRIA